jgi:hypothetical protein
MEADMRRLLPTVSLALATLVWHVPAAIAQDTKTARGTVTAMAANGITVKAADHEMKFAVDAKTTVTVDGGSTASREAAAAGKAGPKLAELIKVGDPVEVSYHEMGGSLHAARIRRVTSVGSSGMSAPAAKSESSTGTVEAVSGNSLTVAAAGGAKHTFAIDADTKVVGAGAGTAAAAKGGKLVISDYIGKGDRVVVTYHTMGSMMHAAEVRVTQKAK